MDKIFKINNDFCISEHHLIQTTEDWVEAGSLKTGDKIVGPEGEEIIITKIIKCRNKKKAKPIK